MNHRHEPLEDVLNRPRRWKNNFSKRNHGFFARIAMLLDPPVSGSLVAAVFWGRKRSARVAHVLESEIRRLLNHGAQSGTDAGISNGALGSDNVGDGTAKGGPHA